MKRDCKKETNFTRVALRLEFEPVWPQKRSESNPYSRVGAMEKKTNIFGVSNAFASIADRRRGGELKIY